MRQLLLVSAAVLLLACERDATAPLGFAPDQPTSLSATSAWTTERLIVNGDDSGPIDCLGAASSHAWGAWVATYHWVILPDGRMNLNWSATWEPGSYILINNQSWVFAGPFPERAIARFDEDGNGVVEHGNIGTATWRNDVTGAVLHLPMHWFISYGAGGVVIKYKVETGCRVTKS